MRTKSTGQAAVEFALVLPIALMILFIVVDFGRAVFAYSTAAQAARDGSRMAIVEQRKVTVDLAAIRGAPTLGLTATNVDVCYKTSGTALRDCNSGGDICSPLEDRMSGDRRGPRTVRADHARCRQCRRPHHVDVDKHSTD